MSKERRGAVIEAIGRFEDVKQVTAWSPILFGGRIRPVSRKTSFPGERRTPRVVHGCHNDTLLLTWGGDLHY
jgi:hypothetical protein